MTDDPVADLIQRYLRAEIDLAESSEAVMALTGGSLGFSVALHDLDAEARERAEALMGRVLWLTLRSLHPEAAPDQPFGAAEARAFLEDMVRNANRDSGSGPESGGPPD